MEDLREILFVKRVCALRNVVDEMKESLNKISCNLKEFIPNVTILQESRYESFPNCSFGITKNEDESEEKETQKTNSTASLAVLRTQKLHRNLFNRPPTPIAKLSSLAVSSSTSSDVAIKSHANSQLFDKSRSDAKSEFDAKFITAKKVKEWIFPPLTMKRMPKSVAQDNEISQEPSFFENSQKSSDKSSCEHLKKTSPISSSSTSSEKQHSNLRSSCIGNNWKCRYEMNDGDLVEPTLQTMVIIKDSVLNPSMVIAESVYLQQSPCSASNRPSVFVDDRSPCSSPSSVYMKDVLKSQLTSKNQIQSEKSNFNGKNNVVTQTRTVQTQTKPIQSYESSLSLPSIKQDESISLIDVLRFGGKESSWYTVSENNPSNVKAAKVQRKIGVKQTSHESTKVPNQIGRSRLGRIQSTANCRKHRMYCISCGRQFKSKQIAAMKENRRSMIRVGLVRQLVDKWEILCNDCPK